MPRRGRGFAVYADENEARRLTPALVTAPRTRLRTETVTMAKKIRASLTLQIEAGKANPAPPVGPALGQHGINIMGFCKEYNEKTANQAGSIVPAEITVFEDRSFSFVLKTPPASDLLKKAAGLEKGSRAQKREKVGDAVARRAEEDRRDEDEGPERERHRCGDQDGRRHGPQHGHRGQLARHASHVSVSGHE